MIKKIIVGICLTACAASTAVAGVMVKKSGMLRKMPEPVYLTQEEAASRPVYKSLDQQEQAVYTAMYRGMNKYETEIPLPYDISGETYNKMYCIIEKQESGMFFLDSTYYTATRVEKARVLYRDSAGNITIEKKKLEEAADEIVKNAPDGGDFEKALYIHDQIVQLCEYSADDNLRYSSTAYGCLVEHIANCEGYAKAFSYLSGKLGMKSVVVTGTTKKGENHAWNQVCVNDSWYNIDVTWDDIDEDNDHRKIYFLCTDKDFEKSHFADNKYFQTFECSDLKDTYYVRMGLYAQNNEDAERIIQREAVAGNERIEIRFADENVYRDFKETYIKNQGVFRVIDESGFGRNGHIVEYCENEQERCLVICIK